MSTVSVHVSTYVDIDLDEIDTSDLVKELRRRRMETFGMDDDEKGLVIMQRLHAALKLGNDGEALGLARNLVGEALGVIL